MERVAVADVDFFVGFLEMQIFLRVLRIHS